MCFDGGMEGTYGAPHVAVPFCGGVDGDLDALLGGAVCWVFERGGEVDVVCHRTGAVDVVLVCTD